MELRLPLDGDTPAGRLITPKPSSDAKLISRSFADGLAHTFHWADAAKELSLALIRTGIMTGCVGASIYRILWFKKDSRSILQTEQPPVLAGSSLISLLFRVQNTISRGVSVYFSPKHCY